MSSMQCGTLATAVATIVLSGTLTPHCGAQDRGDREAERREAQAESFLTASKLVGMPIQVVDDERIGVVHEILLDPVSCEQFVLIDTSGVLDLDGMVVMPLQIFEFQRVAVARQPAVLFVNVPIARIREAPIISVTDIDLALSAAWVTEVNTFFEAEVKQRRVARPELDGRERPARPDTPDTDEPRPRPRTPRTDDETDPAPTPRTDTPRGDDQPETPRNPRTPRRGSDTPPDRDADPQPDRDADPQPDRDADPQPRDREPDSPPESAPDTGNP